ncbi:MAG: 50S ribosomal protein L36 [Alphaproteobacteria bacterium]|nr:50S ribosomal protein L36 [Alphaproteobacteria bacterium]
MKHINSLRAWFKRDTKNNQIIKRHGKTLIINKKNPRLKATQG